LAQGFRDITCKNAEIELNYIDSHINTASLGNLYQLQLIFSFYFTKK